MPRLLIAATVAVTLRQFLAPYARHFRALGWRVDGMAQGIEACAGCEAAFDQTFEAPWGRSPLATPNYTHAVGAVRKVVAAGEYDLVHVHTPVAAFVTRFALRKQRVARKLRVIYTAHGFHFHPLGNPLRNAVFILLERMAGSWTDALVVINKADEAAARRHRIVASRQIHYMPGIGVDTSLYDPTSVSSVQVTRLRSEMGLQATDRLFLVVAEFNPGKRHRDVLRALARLNRPDTHLAFAGDGKLRQELQCLATELGISARTHFLGTRSDIPALLRTALALILVSEREGLPRSVMEALSLEVPVIGTRIRGTSDLLGGGGGLMIPVGDIVALSKAMTWMLEHEEEARFIGQRGRKQMGSYDISNVTKLHEVLYSQLLQ